MKRLSKLIGTLSIVIASFSSNAALITQTENFSFVAGGSTTIDFDAYDGLSGTLISVELIFNLAASGGSLTVDNDGTDGGVISTELGALGSISGTTLAPSSLLNALFGPVIPTLTITETDSASVAGNDLDSDADFDNDGGPDNFTTGPINVSDSTSGFVAPGFISLYQGSDFTFTVSAAAVNNFSGLGGLAGAFVPVNLSGFVTINYTTQETPVLPEPGLHASLGLMALLCSVFMRSRRRLKK